MCSRVNYLPSFMCLMVEGRIILKKWEGVLLLHLPTIELEGRNWPLNRWWWWSQLGTTLAGEVSLIKKYGHNGWYKVGKFIDETPPSFWDLVTITSGSLKRADFYQGNSGHHSKLMLLRCTTVLQTLNSWIWL